MNALAAISGGVEARAEDGNKNGGDGKRAYMAAVSPWFFTHYSPETFNKNVRIPFPFPWLPLFSWLMLNTHAYPVHLSIRPAPLLETLGVLDRFARQCRYRGNPDVERLWRVTLHWAYQGKSAE